MNAIRQGDVYLKPCKSTKEGKRVAPENGRLILARGEATGHHHSISAECATLTDVDGRVRLEVRVATPLEHQEHGVIEVAPGTYWVVRQREYTPQEIRRVMD